MSKKRTGIPSLAYMGVEASTPPQFTVENRAPLSSDYTGYNLGHLWLYDTSPQQVYILTSKSGKVSTWVEFTTDGGSHVFNDLEITNNLTLSFLGAGTLRTDASGVVDVLSDGTDLQVYAGRTGDVPHWGTLTSTGATVTITKTAGGINFETTIGDVTDVNGGTNITTVNSGGPVVTVNLDDNVTLAGFLSAGTGVTSTTGNLVATAGTAQLGSQGRGVVQSDATGLLSSSEGTNGQLLISSSSGAPAWANLTAGAGIALTNGPNSVTIDATGSAADVGRNWIARSSAASSVGYLLYSVSYDGSTYYVAVGASGQIRTTTDLTTTWVSQTSGTANTLTGIVHDGTRFVIAGSSGIILYATTPTSWTSSSVGSSDNLADIGYDGSTYHVALCDNSSNGIYYTSDPTGSWTQNTSGFPSSITMRRITYANGYWVAVGVSGRLMYATDPTGSWSTTTLGTFDMWSVVYGNGDWVVTGGGQVQVSSTNPPGSWTAYSVGSDRLFSASAYGSSYFVSCGYRGLSCSTTDPTTPWTVGYGNWNYSGCDIQYVIHNGSDTFVAVGGGDIISTLTIP